MTRLKFGYRHSNVPFKEGYIERLEQLVLADGVSEAVGLESFAIAATSDLNQCALAVSGAYYSLWSF